MELSNRIFGKYETNTNLSRIERNFLKIEKSLLAFHPHRWQILFTALLSALARIYCTKERNDSRALDEFSKKSLGTALALSCRRI